jgi:hypothetical protein
MREYQQSLGNLTLMGNNLYELIKGGNLVVYPDDQIRRAVSHAVAKETPSGWKITKEKSAHKIDVVVALAMAALAAAEQGQRDGPLLIHDPVVPRLDLGMIGELTNPALGEAALVSASGPAYDPSTVSPWDLLSREEGGSGRGIGNGLAHLGIR